MPAIRREIADFNATWNFRKNKGTFTLIFDDGSKETVVADSPAEFAAIVGALSQKPVFLSAGGGGDDDGNIGQ